MLALLTYGAAAGGSVDVFRNSPGVSSKGNSSATASGGVPSQTSSAATAATAQAAQAGATAQKAQDSFLLATAAFQAQRNSQSAAHQAAINNPLNNLGSDPGNNPGNGLGAGLLNPAGGATVSSSGAAIQVVQLGTGTKSQLSLGSGGTVTLPTGTTGTDQVTISGTGSVTTTSGSLMTKAGSVTTTTGGTLVATDGGSIALTAGTDTISSATPVTITSTLAGTVTLPSGGGTVALAANQTAALPAGSTITFTGSSTGTVQLTGTGTLNLTGAGTLALANAVASNSGGTITTGSGTTTFSNGAVSSLAAGTTINLTGSGAITFSGTATDSLPVILNSASAFTTTGTVLATTGYNLPSSWVNVGALSQSTGSGATTVTITQDAQQALLNWSTFNIGKNTTLDFDQSAGGANLSNWVAINRILDPSLAPSQILGSIEAPGQVYVINQNGIIFNGSSQVNTHALVASTLPINENLVSSGLLENPYGQFLFSSQLIPSYQGSAKYDPNNDPNALPNVTSGNIVVEDGAEITSPTNAEHVGGKIALVAPSIDNEGLLSSPDGQVILAAGQQVGFTAHPSSDPSLRGLDVAIGADPGTANNGVDGFIDAERADVTITGQNVNQLGFIDSTTSVTLNGRIDLLAIGNLTPLYDIYGNDYVLGAGFNETGGTVTLGANSLTEILPEYDSTETVVGTSLALPSQIYVSGEIFHMGTDAQLVAPNATATLSLGILNAPIATTAGETTVPLPEDQTVHTSLTYLAPPGQVYLDAGANIDVSGSNDVAASVTENIVSAQLRGAELADSPLQQDGPLRGQTVDIDITKTGTNPDGSTWIGSPIGDLSGYVALVQHEVGELTSAGGSVAIDTNGSVVMQPTSTINVSGGSIDYQGATVQTTKVITTSGQVLDISQASPDLTYEGIYNGFTESSSKYGVSQTFQSPLVTGAYYEAGYIQGGNAGSLTISTPAAALDGSLYGNTTTGTHQQLSPPTPGALNLTIAEYIDDPPVVNITFQEAPSGQAPVDAFSDTADQAVALSSDRQSNIYLSPDLLGADGFGDAVIDTPNGNVTVQSDAHIAAQPGGSLSLTGTNVGILGQIYIPGGSVQIQSLSDNPDAGGATGYDSTRGNFELYAGGIISTAGLSFDELSGQVTPGVLPFTVSGGKVSINASATLLDAGSTIDVSGTAARNVAGKVSSGNGGTISLTGLFEGTDGSVDGGLFLDGTIEGYGVGKGGSLALVAPAVQVGAGVAPTADPGASLLTIDPSFFSQGGFSSFSVVGTEGMEVHGTIAPILTKEVVNDVGNEFSVSQISSADLPQYPAAPVSLFFSAPGTSALVATLIMDGNIQVPATSSVFLTGEEVSITGQVVAPGGQIGVAGNFTGEAFGTLTPPDVNVYLGSQSVLSTAGEAIATTTQLGGQTYNTGTVLNGGTVTLMGDIVGESGAVINADGTSGVLDVPLASTTIYPSQAFQRTMPYVSETVASNGGTITLNGQDEFYYDGSVSAKAGNQTASGGTLVISSGLATSYTLPPNAGYPEIFLKQAGTYLDGQTITLGTPLNGVTDAGGAHFTVDQFAAGGFDSLSMNGNVEFQGDIVLHANKSLTITPDSLNGTIFADGTAGQTISLSASYVDVGASSLTFSTGSVSAFAPPYVTDGSETVTPTVPGLVAPTDGSATFSVNADNLIDVNFLSLQGFDTSNFSVANGDLRGGGLLYAAGTLNLTAGQIYTPTASNFTIAAFDTGTQLGTVNIYGGSTRSLPLSAGGTINVYGSIINQDGVIRAPFGEINLGALVDPTTGLTPVLPEAQVEFGQTGEYVEVADYSTTAQVTQQLTLGNGSITSVSGVDPITGKALDLPYGTNLNGVQYIDPTGADITTGGLKAKQINLDGLAINDESGALVDLTGGGDLFAYRFNPGLGGTNDILASTTTSFAIIPGYQPDYAPIDLSIDSSGATPYANSAITGQVGNQVYLVGGDGLAPGYYTILPARYALLPGAYLVTPQTSTPAQTTQNPDGSVIMAGYRTNNLNPNQQVVPTVTGFEVDSSTVVNSRAEYDISSANTFLKASAIADGEPVPRLPVDAGQLVFNATNALQIASGATLLGMAGTGGLGSTVDIGSSSDIYIEPDGVSGPSDALTLDANSLTGFGADSLLIGGIRGTAEASGTAVTAMTSNIYVDNNSSAPLTGPDIILVSKDNIDVAPGAVIEQVGTLVNAPSLVIGNADTLGSGDGTSLRVSSDPTVGVTRLGVDTTDTAPSLTIGANAVINGATVILDSTAGTTIDPSAAIDQGNNGQSLVLQSGQISFQLEPNVSIPSNTGLVISATSLAALQNSVQTLSLLSYSSIDFYGAGTLGELDAKGNPTAASLSLSAADLRGYDSDGGVVTLNAQNVAINNSIDQPLTGMPPPLPSGAESNSLVINANTINFGANAFEIDGYSTTEMIAADGMLATGTGSLRTAGALDLVTPLLTGAEGANYSFAASGGSLAVSQASIPGKVAVTGGLGASLALTGTSVSFGTTVATPSGTIAATATSGNVELQNGAVLTAAGEAITFSGVTKSSNGGQVDLTSNGGDVILDAGSQANVSAPSTGGNAGALNISAAGGTLTAVPGTMLGSAGTGGTGGNFNLVAGVISDLSAITNPLDTGKFQSLAFEAVSGDVDVNGPVGAALGSSGASLFSLTADAGQITVDSTINASGTTGGTIDLYANGEVTLTNSAVLSVAAQQFNDAGQGGLVDLETRGAGTTGINIKAGSLVDLSVAANDNTDGTLNPALVAENAALGRTGGTLYLRAPQTQNSTSLQVDPISGMIKNAASIVAEGYKTYTSTTGIIDNTAANGDIEDAVAANVTIFGASGTDTAITSALVGSTVNSGYASNSVLKIEPGEEIVNPNGDLTLNSNWDLSSIRTASGLPGDLTIRASGNLAFNGSLTDGFAYNAADVENVAASPYTWDVLAGPSWSYRLVAGAAFTGTNAIPANFGSVQSLAALGLDNSSLTNADYLNGSLLLGKDIPVGFNYKTTTATTAGPYAQLIRTGTGNITIDTGGSVDLLNQLVSIYTSGSLAPTLAGFTSPTPTPTNTFETTVYGQSIDPAPQYTAQYTENGGNVAINAQQDIVHLTQDDSGDLVPDTSLQFPTNWLYRRGATSAPGVFDTTRANPSEEATTTWWINFSNFFEGVGTLGGGNVSLAAGGNIVNVDAVVPTNARLPFATPGGTPLADSASNLVELGGGDLTVTAGGTIMGGDYYVERGAAHIDANTINSDDDTARISTYDIDNGASTPLPLTLFLGDGSISVNATNDVTVGSTANPFLLPQGIGNGFNDNSIFSTYAADASVNVSSLLGSITVQGGLYTGGSLPGSLSDAYLSNASGFVGKGVRSVVNSDNATPWTLTLDANGDGTGFNNGVMAYTTFYDLSPPIFRATAYAGSIQYDSNQLLAPSTAGTLQLLAAASISGAYNSDIAGFGQVSTITISDADPSQLPSVTNPVGLGSSSILLGNNNPAIDVKLNQISSIFTEMPSYALEGLSTLQSFHTSGLLHDNDTTAQIDTISGDISDFTLISAEKVAISSGLDLQDVGFYIQNNNANDISVVTANRDITLYDPNSTQLVALGDPNDFLSASGDIEISGPGALEILAGRNLDLGVGTALADGTGVGVTSIGNSRNPYLPFDGAQIIAAAGIGSSSGLAAGNLDFALFIDSFLNPTPIISSDDPSGTEAARYLPDLAADLNLTGESNDAVFSAFEALTPQQQDVLALSIFYEVLRDAGRDHNDPTSPNVGTYTEANLAIADLLPSTVTYTGDISLTSREIQTTNGGDISLFAPGGAVNVGIDLPDQPQDQGILTVDGGNINIYTEGNVNVGTSRIFTLHGGNEIIYSQNGNIDAGNGSKTVQSAPPTRVLVDPQSADVKLDLAGLATGKGIGVLATVVGAPPGNVDLIAPKGIVDAGDAGIRSSGNINIAAVQVLNASNIEVSGKSSGVPTTTSPNISAVVAASSAGGATQNAAAQTASQQQPSTAQQTDFPSIISVQVLGYGGGDDDSASATPGPVSPESARASYFADRR